MRSSEWHRSAFQAADHKPFQKNLLKEIRAIIVDILSGFNYTRDVRSKRYLLAVSRFLVEHLHDSGFHLIEISFVVVVFLSRTYLLIEGLEPTPFSGFSPTLSNPGNDVGLE